MTDYGDLFSNGYQVRWNASSLSAFDKCPQYYQYTILEGWTSPNLSVHLWFGGHYAAAMEQYHLHRFEGKGHTESVIAVVHTTLIATWDAAAGQPIDYQETKNRFNLIRSIIWYFEEFRSDLPVAEIGGKPAVELKVEADIGGGVSLVGKLDRVYVYDDVKMVMDQKSTGSTITPHYFTQWKPSTQMSQYSFLGQVVFDEGTPPGVMIDAAQIAVGFTRFARQPTYRTPRELEEFLGEAKDTMEAAHASTDRKRFRRNPASCNNYGGCAFKEICSKSPEVRLNFLKSSFVQRKPE